MGEVIKSDWQRVYCWDWQRDRVGSEQCGGGSRECPVCVYFRCIGIKERWLGSKGMCCGHTCKGGHLEMTIWWPAGHALTRSHIQVTNSPFVSFLPHLCEVQHGPGTGHAPELEQEQWMSLSTTSYHLPPTKPNLSISLVKLPPPFMFPPRDRQHWTLYKRSLGPSGIWPQRKWCERWHGCHGNQVNWYYILPICDEGRGHSGGDHLVTMIRSPPRKSFCDLGWWKWGGEVGPN